MTLRVVNKLSSPIYVADEFDQLGLEVQQERFTKWTRMAEYAACDCQDCARACDVCSCPTFQAMVRRIDPGASAERVWEGEYRADDKVNCFTGEVKSCLGERRAAQAGSYKLELCFASSVAGAPTDQQRFAGTLPAREHQTCRTLIFQMPSDEPVVIQTDQPPGCRSQGDCPADQLCLSGQCSSSCTSSDVPALGGEWTVEVGQPDNLGFFTVTDGPNGAKVYKGAGTVESARFTTGTTNLTVVRTSATGIDLKANLYYTLPSKRALALTRGDAVEITVVDHPAGTRKMARGVALKKAGTLALVADNGFGGAVLDAAATAPFVVQTGGEVFACDVADCGQRMHRRMSATGGDPALQLDAGKSGLVRVGELDYEVVAVANYADEVDGCGPTPMSPYVILLQETFTP